jgi:hypothetical protein
MFIRRCNNNSSLQRETDTEKETENYSNSIIPVYTYIIGLCVCVRERVSLRYRQIERETERETEREIERQTNNRY